MIQRSNRTKTYRAIIAINLSMCQKMVDEGKVTSLSRRFMGNRLDQALRYARLLPDNPGNRAIRASIVGAMEALNHDAR